MALHLVGRIRRSRRHPAMVPMSCPMAQAYRAYKPVVGRMMPSGNGADVIPMAQAYPAYKPVVGRIRRSRRHPAMVLLSCPMAQAYRAYTPVVDRMLPPGTSA